jgi:hypothetical protein
LYCLKGKTMLSSYLSVGGYVKFRSPSDAQAYYGKIGAKAPNGGIVMVYQGHDQGWWEEEITVADILPNDVRVCLMEVEHALDNKGPAVVCRLRTTMEKSQETKNAWVLTERDDAGNPVPIHEGFMGQIYLRKAKLSVGKVPDRVSITVSFPVAGKPDLRR